MMSRRENDCECERDRAENAKNGRIKNYCDANLLARLSDKRTEALWLLLCRLICFDLLIY
jgi:hypothetical protein